MPSKRPLPNSFYLEALGVDVERVPFDSDIRVDVETPLTEIWSHNFDRCPICLEPEPGHKEHVPPESIGGDVQTVTCKPCNSDLGSRVEDELFAWYAGALGRVRISSPGSDVQGPRDAGEMFFFKTPADEFVLIGNRKPNADIDQMLASRRFGLEFSELDRAAYHIGALKQAYLAACLQLKEIPQSASAEAIRSDLIAARNATRRSVPRSAIADALMLARSYGSEVVPPLAFGKARTSLPGVEWVIAMAGKAGPMYVSWPFPDAPPAMPEG